MKHLSNCFLQSLLTRAMAVFFAKRTKTHNEKRVKNLSNNHFRNYMDMLDKTSTQQWAARYSKLEQILNFEKHKRTIIKKFS